MRPPEDTRRHLGQDLDVGFRADDAGWHLAGPYAHVDLHPRQPELAARRGADLGVVSGTANLVQSLILRLKTGLGELAPLGFPDYGTRHLALVGEPNTEGNRNLVKLFVVDCLRHEPRLERIEEITVAPCEGRENRDTIDIRVRVRVRGVPDPLSLVVPFSFEGPVG